MKIDKDNKNDKDKKKSYFYYCDNHGNKIIQWETLDFKDNICPFCGGVATYGRYY